MNLLEQSESMQWLWQGKSTKLKDLHYNQLTSILETIRKNPRDWFGTSAESWESSIRLVIKHYHLERYRSNLQGDKARVIVANFCDRFKQLKID